MSVKIHDDEKGHWYQVFHNGQRPKSHFGFGPVAKKTCAASAAEVLKKIAQGKFSIKTDDELKTLKEAGDDLFVPSAHRRDSTLDSYGYALEHIYPTLGAKMIGEITTKDIEALLTRWRTDAKGSIELRLNVLNVILNHCVRKDWIRRNPAAGLEPAFKRSLRKRDKVKTRRAMSTTQLDTVLDAVQAYTDSALFYVFWLLLGRTGLRISEAMALQPDDIEVEMASGHSCRRILVQRAFHKKRIGPTKTGLSRYVDLSPEIAGALDRVLDEFRGSGADWIFPSPRTDMPLSYLYWRNHLVAATKQVRLGMKLTPHIFRHTFASQLLSKGENNLLYTSEQLGHAKPSMTLDVYGHFLPPKDNVAPVNSLDTGRAGLPPRTHAPVLVHSQKANSQRRKGLAA
jgi:integrase